MLLNHKHNDNNGISLRTIHTWLIVGAVIIAGMMFSATYHLSTKFQYLTKNTEQQIQLRKAAREFMDASDYLTENVQRFTMNADLKFLEKYFTEVFTKKRREEAINIMSSGKRNSSAFGSLQAAMLASEELMKREYYAMKLVIDAKEYSNYPEIINSVKLSDDDKALESQEKMRRASEIVHDYAYFNKKEQIRENIRSTLDSLEKMAYDIDASALKALRSEMFFLRFVIIFQIAGIFIMVYMTSHLGITPVLNAVDRIKADKPIPEIGANEFRYLARAYNKMYKIYKRSLEKLNFKASHDELTGAYNRCGYDLLLSSVELKDTYMLLFDADNFKSINDKFGHETGDKILVKIVRTLKNNFRSDDYVCRLGGDEFIVLMVHVENNNKNLIISKILEINKELAQTDDGLPATSLSAGITHGSYAEDTKDLFNKADEVMYKSKKKGKSTYTFYM